MISESRQIPKKKYIGHCNRKQQIISIETIFNQDCVSSLLDGL
jgi:hypothetical protein